MINPVFMVERQRKTEWWEIITADGLRYRLENFSGRWVINLSGDGMPPIRYLAQRGPFQDGVTVTDFFLEPRTVELVLRDGRCTRQQYWDARALALDRLRPNRSTNGAIMPARLRKILPDGTKRDLEVFVDDGLRFTTPTAPAGWDEFAFEEPIRLFAPDPTWFSPTEVDVVFTLATQSQLVFPITFPITFGTGILSVSQNITYAGSWPSFPVITLQGPLNGPSITNVTIGEEITLAYDIPLGETVTIDLEYGRKTVVNNLGTNLIGTVDSGSELGTWRLEVDPRAPGGVNDIQVTGSDADANTAVSLAYFTRYIGLGG